MYDGTRILVEVVNNYINYTCERRLATPQIKWLNGFINTKMSFVSTDLGANILTTTIIFPGTWMDSCIITR